MAATLELKYFNTFWLKKIKSITDVETVTPIVANNTAVNTTVIDITNTTDKIKIGAGQIVTNLTNTTSFATGIVTVVGRNNLVVTVSTPALSTTTSANAASTASTTLTLTTSNANVKIGMAVTGTGITAGTYIASVTNPAFVFELNQVATLAVDETLTYTSSINITTADNLTFTGKASDVGIPQEFTNDPVTSWYEEESRIRGGYNNLTVDFGVKAYLVEDTTQQQNRIAALIYSGLFNSRTGINNTNQFSVGTDITKSADPANGSIQKLYAEDTNLIIFQENKVSRALIDKDAIYSAEGSAAITSTPLVIGQIVPYAGEYGISKDPESFAVYGYRKYFTDRSRGAVLRLSRDGMTEISSYGMHDFFRDELSSLSTNKIVGSWDNHTKNYVISIQSASDYKTISFDEDVLGWTTFLDFKPSYAFSLNNLYYTFNTGKMYQHHVGNYAKFYGITYGTSVTIVLNSQPSVVKVFETINYEGSNHWQLASMVGSSGDVTLPIGSYQAQTTLAGLEGALFSNNFKKKESKFFANLINNSPSTAGEVVFGNSMTGIKGFFATVKMEIPAIVQFDTSAIKKELFSVASNVVESSY